MVPEHFGPPLLFSALNSSALAPTLNTSCMWLVCRIDREGIIQGHQNYDLTPIGVNQAEATATRLRGHTYWQTYSSDLTRAYRTAEIILEAHPGSTLVKTPLLREFGLGAQEGLPRGTTWCVQSVCAGRWHVSVFVCCLLTRL